VIFSEIFSCQYTMAYDNGGGRGSGDGGGDGCGNALGCLPSVNNATIVTTAFLSRPTATLDISDVGMEEIGGGGTDIRPTQIALVFDAGCNCVGDTALMMLLRLVGR
jgi:hypothetical protein